MGACMASFFFRWGGASWLGCASAMGVARLGRVDKELMGIFVACFVLGVVWWRGRGVACL